MFGNFHSGVELGLNFEGWVKFGKAKKRGQIILHGR
jgi:hypothetical protein